MKEPERDKQRVPPENSAEIALPEGRDVGANQKILRKGRRAALVHLSQLIQETSSVSVSSSHLLHSPASQGRSLLQKQQLGL